MFVPSSSKGVVVALGIVLALLLYPLVNMALAWALGVVLIAVVLFALWVIAVRLYRRAIGVQ